MKLPAHFMLRAVRGGPLVPARLWLSDYEPEVPENKLDRGRLSPYPRADIAGVEVPPEQLLDRLGIWPRRGDGTLLPHEAIAALADPTQQTPRPIGHWAYAEPITKAEYDYQLLRLRWAQQHRPDDPALTPRQKIDSKQLPLPNFDREHQTLGERPA